MDSSVIKSMQDCFDDQLGNPSSNHSYGRKSLELINEARSHVAEAVGALPKEVYFTSSGSESNNWFVNGMALVNPDASFYYGATEHPCVIKPMQNLITSGICSQKIGVDANGKVNIEELKDFDKNKIKVISLMFVNNESGTIQDLIHVKEILGKNTIFHSDAVQALGKIPFNFNNLGLDAMTISSHKINGPHGIAAMIIKNGLDIEPFISGGGQENGLRSGTENIAAIVGFGKACQLAKAKSNDTIAIKRRRDFFEKEIKNIGGYIFGANSNRVANTSFFGFMNIDGATLITALDKYGIGIASGSACSTNNKEPSHVLIEMGIEPDVAQTAIRMSLSHENTDSNVEYLLDKIKFEVTRLNNYTSLMH